ncbi:conserved Plasmodium protein, unknown function [Plasmodium gallinaceum]|uniref:RAP protein n=1 Tax=Plasmodium gallinaceum TaxID=5849 RepID=A0A1J1GTX0_PLAGA|nr:conserved Plasmodium protein, unknown function [Plasmodium gallinaceum]CRG94758.1 conserved Plasmodium protein, unknown function [Plasmodium gallinaceum]
MFKKLLFNVFVYREKSLNLCRKKKNILFIKNEKSISSYTEHKKINDNEKIKDRKKKNYQNINFDVVKRYLTSNKYMESNNKFTSQKENNENDKNVKSLNETNEINSIENILDETNSMIYINEICLKMDQVILKCQHYEDILSILVTHRGALFLQNLITAIRMLSGFVIEEKKKRIEKEKLNLSNEYTKHVKAEELEVENDQMNDENKQNIDNINITDTENINTKLNDNNTYASDMPIINNINSMSCETNNETVIDKIEKNLIEKYKHIFDVLNDKKLLENENNFQKNRKIEEIIVLDERYNLLIEDIYKNRKHFDVVSICHILISLKELNHKHFLLFNSFVNPLKNFDIYIKEQFESNQKISYINSTMQLLLECFNTYIWAGYYNLDIYNKLINSILLNNFIRLNKALIYAHYEQLNNYTNMNYNYNVNYPISTEELLRFFNLDKNFIYMNFLSKDPDISYSISKLVKYEENNENRETQLKDIENIEIKDEFTKQENYIMKNKDDLIKKKKKDSISEISTFVCPIFLNLELFLKSLEIYKNIYVYNPEFFKISEKVVYYYTPYLSPFNLSMIADAFSKHRIFTIEHDRIFFHISKILEKNFQKFSYENIFLILRAFKKMNLFFEKCIILSANKFREYFHYLYINRKESILTLKDVSVLMESLSFFNFTHKFIDQCIIAALNYLEDYIDDIDEETSINISYALILSNLFHVNTYFFSFIWRKIGKTTYWEKRKSQIFLLWLSHMIQFKWLDFDLPKFCVLESLKVFYLKRKENMFSFSKIIYNISKILDDFQISHEVSVEIDCPYVLDILIKKNRQVIMLTQDTTRNEITRELGDFKIISNHLKLYGYNVKCVNTKYFDSLNDENKREYIKNILMSF